MNFSGNPLIIQGGMGMGVSDWRLAKTVSQLGQLGVISGTAIDNILVRRLQDGDSGGHMRRALRHFPVPAIAARLIDEYFIAGGKPADVPYKRIPMFSLTPSKTSFELSVAAAFTEVFLAKEGHDGVVGMNLLYKILFPNLSTLYGALLAGVDYILMGAGIPREIPAILDRLSRHESAELKVVVEGDEPEEYRISFDPQIMMGSLRPPLKRPRFLAIISSATLALALAKKADGYVDGFVVEGVSAGGHNAPPRGHLQLNERGEPVYGQRDEADLAKIKALGRPFWLAGAFATPEKLSWALDQGAAGVQVGTAFAFCDESGMATPIKQAVLSAVLSKSIDVFTDPSASPTGFPFKVVQLSGTISDEEEYAHRHRLCDLGYLRTPYKRSDGTIGYRCPSENPEDFQKKGGEPVSTQGRKCLCNGLLAAIGLAQQQVDGYVEHPIVTAGDDIQNIDRYLKAGARSYSAGDVIDCIVSEQRRSS